MDWIKVTPETMPEEEQYVLVTAIWKGEKYVTYAQYTNGHFLSDIIDIFAANEEIDNVTHWMPYPKPAED